MTAADFVAAMSARVRRLCSARGGTGQAPGANRAGCVAARPGAPPGGRCRRKTVAMAAKGTSDDDEGIFFLWACLWVSMGVHVRLFAARVLTLCFVAVSGFIKLAIDAGKASPAPPIGPALGSKGINIMAI